MAIMTKVSTVCDVCRNPKRRTKTYRVQNGEGSWVLTLDREHAQPLLELLQYATEVPATRRPGPPVKLWEMDEIEAERKRQQK